MQDLSQIAKNYGQEVLDVLIASVGTKVITRINFGPTAERMERDLGETTFYEYRRDMMTDGTTKWLKETHRASPIERSEFSTELGVDDKGVTAFVTGIGKNVYQVKFPS
ncbi:type IV secretion system DNA-binding domain-containing protein [Ochrobactrum daejeonense]|nr:type IV secretion system DNA-binding domain-containing protein [Brucella daejeonensis]